MSWKPEVKVSGEWASNALRFATKEEAEKSAKDLYRRWALPTDSRATQSSDPVNYKFENGKNVRLSESSSGMGPFERQVERQFSTG